MAEDNSSESDIGFQPLPDSDDDEANAFGFAWAAANIAALAANAEARSMFDTSGSDEDSWDGSFNAARKKKGAKDSWADGLSLSDEEDSDFFDSILEFESKARYFSKPESNAKHASSDEDEEEEWTSDEDRPKTKPATKKRAASPPKKKSAVTRTQPATKRAKREKAVAVSRSFHCHADSSDEKVAAISSEELIGEPNGVRLEEILEEHSAGDHSQMYENSKALCDETAVRYIDAANAKREKLDEIERSAPALEAGRNLERGYTLGGFATNIANRVIQLFMGGKQGVVVGEH